MLQDALHSVFLGRSLRVRLLLLLILTLLPMAVLTAWYVLHAMEADRVDAYARVSRDVRNVASNLDAVVAAHATLLKSVALEYQSGSPKTAGSFSPQQFLRMHEAVLGIGVRDLTGKTVFATPKALPDAVFLDSRWGREALEADALVIGDVEPGFAKDEWTAILTYPVRNGQGVRTGFAYLLLNLQVLNRLVLGHAPDDIIFPVFDRNDRFLLRSVKPEVFMGKSLPQRNADTVRGKLNETFVAPDIDGTQRLYSVVTMPVSGWRVFGGIAASDVLADGLAKRNMAILVGVLTLIFSLAYGWWRAGTIANPIRRLAADVQKMMSDGDHRTAVSGPIELEEVAQGLNTLLDHIQRQHEEREALSLHYASMLKNARETILLVDTQGRIVDASKAASETYGYTEEELRQRAVTDLRAPNCRASLDSDWKASASIEGALFETLHQRKDGTVFPVEVKSGVLEMEGQLYRQSFVRDISERKEAELALARRTRALEALSACNRALVTARSELELLQSVCNVIVEKGGYRMVLVGFAEHDANKTVRVAAHAGVYDGYLDQHTISWADVPAGQGPTGRAIRNCKTQISLDFVEDPLFALWREPAIQRGYRSSIALPLVVDGVALGALNVYASEPNAFDAPEVGLLEELSHDLAYGIAALRTTEIRGALEESLEDSEERFRNLIEQSPVGIHILRDGVFAYANPRMQEIMGFETGGLVGLRPKDFVLPESWDSYEKAMELLSVRGNTGNFSIAVKRHDGDLIKLGIQYVMGRFAEQTAIIGMAQDISERERIQAELGRYVEALEQTTETTLQAVSAMVEKRDPYTAGHERRVGELAAAIGREMGLTEHQIKGLRLTGFVHDIGKIAVPAELLAKPTRLTETEMALIRVHPQTGYDVLKDVKFPWPVAEVVLQHHERLDGSGYPRGLKGDAILLESRIMSVADVVESMSSHRPYRPGLGMDAALAEVEKYKGSRYDAAVVEACQRLFSERGYKIPD